MRADPGKDSRHQRKTAEEQIRNERGRNRASIQDRSIMGDDDDPNNSDDWTKVPTADDWANKKADDLTSEHST